MNVREYLDRIGFRGPVRVCPEVLIELHQLHLLRVPFENLDIHYGIPIRLNQAAFYRKIVQQRRGGFCYELNGLFYELLSQLGFTVKQVSARVCETDGSYSPDFDHMALVVSLGHTEYLMDVGFGDFFFTPKVLVVGAEQTDRTGRYVFDHDDDEYWRISKLDGEETPPRYKFRNRHVSLEQFEERNHFHQTDIASHFTQKKVVSIATKEGRTTLTADRLKITTTAGQEETAFPAHEFGKRLMDVFRIEIQ